MAAPKIQNMALPGWCLDDPDNIPPIQGLRRGFQIGLQGLTQNSFTLFGAVPTQLGVVVIPAKTAGGPYNLTVSHALVTAKTFITLFAPLNANTDFTARDTTAGRGLVLWLDDVPAAGSFNIGYKTFADMASDWTCWFMLWNGF